jgi:UDP-GlcNAc:undecaprenyl-phosphate/decaprenyl-phosphate GlcNAc-1-phosphate transferase
VLFLPLVVLAIPILDTSFVVARRLKYGESPFAPDQAHLHFRFLRRGYSQRRAAVIMWGWAGTLATVALATRFIPLRAGGEWHLWETLAYLAVGLVALAFSIYVVYLLEIVKLASPRARRREREAEEQRLSA